MVETYKKETLGPKDRKLCHQHICHFDQYGYKDIKHQTIKCLFMIGFMFLCKLYKLKITHYFQASTWSEKGCS